MSVGDLVMNGKAALYLGFNKLMKEKDFSDISISEIVKEAGINRNTFYYHFKDINEFVKAFLEDEILNTVREKIKKNQFNEGFLLLVDYSETHKELMHNILEHNDTYDILVKILHNDIRMDVVKILNDYQAFLHLNLPEKFITFFSHNIVEEYMAAPKEIVYDGVEGKLLKKVFYLYADSIPDKLLKVSSIDFNN